MIRSIFPLFFLLIIPLWTCDAHASWKVELSSGVTVDANSYHIKKGRIYLEYPVGEVSFPLSEIKSVAADSQEVTAFQDKGIPRKEKEDIYQAQGGFAKGLEFNQSSAPAPIASADTAGPSASQQNNAQPNVVKPRFTDEQLAQLVTNSVADTSTPAPYDPDAEAIIQAAENADEAHQAELTQQINKLFDNQE